jgi:hypothetical protein
MESRVFGVHPRAPNAPHSGARDTAFVVALRAGTAAVLVLR